MLWKEFQCREDIRDFGKLMKGMKRRSVLLEQILQTVEFKVEVDFDGRREGLSKIL